MSETNPRFEREFILNSLERSLEFGSIMARGMDTPGVLAFYGGLGSGKTTLIQAIGRALGVEGPVTSPTYTIINSYEGGRIGLVHVDCYRIENPSELDEIGLAEVLGGPQVVCMEWSERAAGFLPFERIELQLAYRGLESRAARLSAYGGLWPDLDRLVMDWLERTGQP